MNEALATFLRGNSARPNAAWALPLPEVRRPRGRIDWYDTLRLFSGSVVALGAPEMMEGLGRLLLFALDAVGGPQETIERAALLLMTGERDVLQFIHGGPWTGDHRQWNAVLEEWARAGGWDRSPRVSREEDPSGELSNPSGDDRLPARYLLVGATNHAVDGATERFMGPTHKRKAESDVYNALEKALGAVMDRRPEMGATEALVTAHGLLSPGQLRPAPLGLRSLTTRQGGDRTVDYYRRDKRVLRAQYFLFAGWKHDELLGRHVEYALRSLEPVPRAKPTEEDYDGAVADLVRRGVSHCFQSLAPGDTAAALLRAGFTEERHAGWEIPPGAIVALDFARPAPRF